MSGIAELLINLGFQVSGSDLRGTLVTERLRMLGATVWTGHSPEHVHAAEVVVVSAAVPPENCEIDEAKRRRIPVIARAEMLAELMRLKFSVAVAGAHGKTTVTSMIALMLTHAGLDPTAVIGGRLDAFGSSARLGKGEIMVVEADESDRSFLMLLPSMAVVTNIDREHLDHYRGLEEIEAAFLSFMNKAPFYGAVITCTDSPWGERLRPLLPHLTRRLVTYGLENHAAVSAGEIELGERGSTFQVSETGRRLGRFRLHVPGRHNVQNALAAVAVGLELGLAPRQIRGGLEQFRGAERRFQVKAEWDGVTVVDDYGHHPAEIRATLEAARMRHPARIWAVFQPHRFTRTEYLINDFGPAFQGCKRVDVLDIYPAGETPIPGVTSRKLVERMRETGCPEARYAPPDVDLVQEILTTVRPGTLVLTIGAGSVGKLADSLAESLKSVTSS